MGKRSVAVLLLTLTLSSCGAQSDQFDRPDLSTTGRTQIAPTSSAPATSEAGQSDVAESESPPTAEPPVPNETTYDEAEQASSEPLGEPVVVECLEGTPGPARWSDGTVQFSQACFDQLGGQAYLDAEREANSRSSVDTRIPTYETRSTDLNDYAPHTNADSADGYGPGVELPPLCVRFPDTYKC